MHDDQDITPARRQTLKRPSDPELMSRAEAAEFLGVSISSLAHWVQAGRGPAFLRLGKSTWYRRADLVCWMQGQRFTPGGA